MSKINSHFTQLEKNLSITFQNKHLLQNAFTHRSYLNEAGKNLLSNERLEFLGDAILEYIVSEYLYAHYPDYPEGKLTHVRSLVVKTNTLATVAQKLNFGKYLLLSKGEEEGGGRYNPSLLADAFEAFLGALFLDQGLSKTKSFLDKILLSQISQIIKTQLGSDYKSSLQEYIQSISLVTPTYQVIKSEGPDHNKTFWVKVIIDNKQGEVGKGKSKQEAEQNAARATLEKMGKL